jgi:hypothetical protein
MLAFLAQPFVIPARQKVRREQAENHSSIKAACLQIGCAPKQLMHVDRHSVREMKQTIDTDHERMGHGGQTP